MLLDPARAGAGMFQSSNIRWASRHHDYTLLEGPFGYRRALIAPMRAYNDRIVLAIPVGTLDPPDQGSFGVPVEVFARDEKGKLGGPSCSGASSSGVLLQSIERSSSSVWGGGP